MWLAGRRAAAAQPTPLADGMAACAGQGVSSLSSRGRGARGSQPPCLAPVVMACPCREMCHSAISHGENPTGVGKFGVADRCWSVAVVVRCSWYLPSGCGAVWGSCHGGDEDAACGRRTRPRGSTCTQHLGRLAPRPASIPRGSNRLIPGSVPSPRPFRTGFPALADPVQKGPCGAPIFSWRWWTECAMMTRRSEVSWRRDDAPQDV
jgi:hypothetical protein